MMIQSRFSQAILFFLLFTGFSLSLLQSTSAYAEERSYGDEIPVKPTNWSDTLSIPLFDPTLGILTKIEFVVVGEVNGRARLENLDAAAATVIAESIADIRLERPDGTFVAAASPAAIKERQLAIFDGTIDFGGPSGAVITDMVGIDISERVIFTDTANLEFFTGNGAIDMNIQTTSRSRATGAGNLALSFSTSAGAAITVTYYFAQPAIDLEKATNGDDADLLPGPALYPGEIVTWTYVVTNIGEVPLVDLTLLDDQEGNVIGGCPKNTLDVAESMHCTHVGTAQSGQYTNTAFVTGNVPDTLTGEPRQVTDDDPSHYSGTGDPAIELEKLTNGEDADLLPGPVVAVGTVVTWSYMVSNVGEIDLEAITLVDDREGDVTAHCPQRTLAIGESMVCEVAGIAQLGQYTNTGVVTGTTPADSVRPNVPVTDDDPSHYSSIQISFCPVDESGDLLLPTIRFLGEGAGEYLLDADEEQFIIKKFRPFRMITHMASSYLSTRKNGAPERVWACSGDCSFATAINEVLMLGPLPKDLILHIAVLDDDDDARVDTIFADGLRNEPLLRLEEQTLTDFVQVTLPQTANWNIDATDSIGIYLCAEE